MKSLLTIVPSRNRNEKIKAFYDAFFATSTISDLVVAIDDDDNYDRIEGVIYEVNPNMKMNHKLNLVANKYAKEYDYLCFLGDDHLPRTYGWDAELVKTIENIPYGIAYANDLLTNFPAAALLDAKIVRKLGYMTPPKLMHLFVDNFWHDLGVALETLRYREDIIIEHMHYSNNKSPMDNIYESANNLDSFQQDRATYMEYLETRFQKDINKLYGNLIDKIEG